MSVLVTTLRKHLEAADRAFADGRLAGARGAYADLLERAQDRADPSMEVCARAMLALCHLRVRDHAAAVALMSDAEWRLEAASVSALARWHRARVRVELEGGAEPIPLLRAYLDWAEGCESSDAVLDACLLLADAHPLEERVDWLERGLDHADGAPPEALAHVCMQLGAVLDQLGQPAAALEAYEQALTCHGGVGSRGGVGAAWAAGEMACRLEDWPLARQHLEAALAVAERSDAVSDLEPLVLGDLATVYQAAGDVVEARRLILRALRRAREQELQVFAPQQHARLRAVARALELE